MTNELEQFYENWQNERANLIDFDNDCAARKIGTILREAPLISDLKIKSAIDFGCGRGKGLRNFFDHMKLETAYGFDYSEEAVEYASRNFGSNNLQFHRLTTLDIDQSINSIKKIVSEKVDCILLIDLLEHVADCKYLILRLSELTNYFIIKLPVEVNFVENYLMRNKTYPSTKQYHGHLREFSINSVYYFIRMLGLTPMSEGLYLYDAKDTQPQAIGRSLRQSLKVSLYTLMRNVLSKILHKKLTIALCGSGGYYCIATFNKTHMLNP